MSKLKIYSKERFNSFIEASRPSLSKRELESVLDCMIAEQLGQGGVTSRLERSFRDTFGYKHALALSSPMAAYHLALLSLEIKAGDHVILSALSNPACCDVATHLGAQVHLLDLGDKSFHPKEEAVLALIEQIKKDDNEQLSRQSSAKEKKFIYLAEHRFGSPLAYELDTIKASGAIVIEDFTGLVGANENFKDDIGVVNTFGEMGSFGICGLSKYDLLTTGNGAMLVTKDIQLHKKSSSLCYSDKREPNLAAYDYRLGDFQAAMGIIQISRLGENLARRKKIGQYYLEKLTSTRHESYFKNIGLDSYLRFPVLIYKEQAEVKRYFRSQQIAFSKITEIPLHRLLGRAPLEFPNAERLYLKSIAVPLYPNLNSSNVDRISSALRALI